MSKTYDDKLKSIVLQGTMLDRRRKLTDEDKEDIRRLYKETGNQREVARQFAHKCSRRLIIFVLFPERLKVMTKRNKKNQHWKTYYNRKQLSESAKNLRHYKINIYKNK